MAYSEYVTLILDLVKKGLAQLGTLNNHVERAVDGRVLTLRIG